MNAFAHPSGLLKQLGGPTVRQSCPPGGRVEVTGGSCTRARRSVRNTGEFAQGYPVRSDARGHASGPRHRRGPGWWLERGQGSAWTTSKVRSAVPPAPVACTARCAVSGSGP
jgi:hypothetical protein